MLSINSWLKASEDYFSGGLDCVDSNLGLHAYMSALEEIAEVLLEDAPNVLGVKTPEVDAMDVVEHYMYKKGYDI